MNRQIHAANVTRWEDYISLFSLADNETALGEICNSYIFCPTALKQIKEEVPEAKIIAIFRNPIKRAFSGYLMNLREGKTLEEDFIKEIETDDQADPKGWGISFNYLSMGLYSEQVQRVLNEFSATDCLFILFDDFVSDKQKTMREIYSFLGVDANFVSDSDKKANAASLPRFKYLNYFIAQTGFLRKAARRILPENAKEVVSRIMYSKSDVPKISEEQFQYLANYYRDDIGKLSGLLNRDLSHWLEY